MRITDVLEKEDLMKKKVLINVVLEDKSKNDKCFAGYFCMNQGLYENAKEDEYESWNDILNNEIYEYQIQKNLAREQKDRGYDLMLRCNFESQFMNGEELKKWIDDHRFKDICCNER